MKLRLKRIKGPASYWVAKLELKLFSWLHHSVLSSKSCLSHVWSPVFAFSFHENGDVEELTFLSMGAIIHFTSESTKCKQKLTFSQENEFCKGFLAKTHILLTSKGVFLFWPCHAACEILVLWLDWTWALSWECGLLTNGLPGNSLAKF